MRTWERARLANTSLLPVLSIHTPPPTTTLLYCTVPYVPTASSPTSTRRYATPRHQTGKGVRNHDCAVLKGRCGKKKSIKLGKQRAKQLKQKSTLLLKMSHDFRKAENALKRAIEYENVGKQTVAMEILHAVLTSRRHRSWTKTHESIMIKLMDLCVELRQVNMAKECLHQYRNITQTQAPHSLEVVIDHML